MDRGIRHFIEDTFLIILIFLNIFDFFHLLPEDIDYVKKIISWTLLAYLFYKFNLPKILFGRADREVNMLIIISYLLLAFKKFIASISALSGESLLFEGFFHFISANAIILERFAFVMGSIILLALACYMAVRFDINKKSLMGIIHESGKAPKHPGRILIRGITIFLVLTSFFIMLFDLIIEWLAIAVDAPLILFAILFYLFYIIRKHKHYKAESIIFRIGNFGEGFYARFVSLFFERKRIFIAISGIIVLHLLTDIGNFMIPFLTGFFHPIYLDYLDPALHQNIYALIYSAAQGQYSIIGFSALIWAYVFSSIAAILLLFLPAYIWYKCFKGKKLRISNLSLALFLGSCAAFAISGVFTLTHTLIRGYVLVDIQTANAANHILASISALLVFGLVIFLTKISILKKSLAAAAIIIIDLFAILYVYNFFASIAHYYIRSISYLWSQAQFITASYFLVFFTITLLFYLVGILYFIRISFKEFWKLITSSFSHK